MLDCVEGPNVGPPAVADPEGGAGVGGLTPPSEVLFCLLVSI